jgi:hypothetical protein
VPVEPVIAPADIGQPGSELNTAVLMVVFGFSAKRAGPPLELGRRRNPVLDSRESPHREQGIGRRRSKGLELALWRE